MAYPTSESGTGGGLSAVCVGDKNGYCCRPKKAGSATPDRRCMSGPLRSDGWCQSRACTLATLSSRVWSLSVRVLIFTVV
jgi:hypothetical protein